MARRIYETSEDRESERAVLDALSLAWHPVVIKQLPQLHPLDGFADFGGYYAWVEVKCRGKKDDLPSTHYSEWMISVEKVKEGMLRHGMFGHGFHLVFEWLDGIFTTDVPQIIGECRIDPEGGRKDRDDPLDTEPCFLIPASAFRKIIVDNTAIL